jgi:hypothetical protein
MKDILAFITCMAVGAVVVIAAWCMVVPWIEPLQDALHISVEMIGEF